MFSYRRKIENRKIITMIYILLNIYKIKMTERDKIRKKIKKIEKKIYENLKEKEKNTKILNEIQYLLLENLKKNLSKSNMLREQIYLDKDTMENNIIMEDVDSCSSIEANPHKPGSETNVPLILSTCEKDELSSEQELLTTASLEAGGETLLGVMTPLNSGGVCEKTIGEIARNYSLKKQKSKIIKSILETAERTGYSNLRIQVSNSENFNRQLCLSLKKENIDMIYSENYIEVNW